MARTGIPLTPGGGGGGYTIIDTQEFTTSGTWTKPAGAVKVRVVAVGGGGGGSGAIWGSSNVSAASGGAGGQIIEEWLDASVLAASETVTIGAGGPGALGDSGGEVATDGGDTSFGDWVEAMGGHAGTSYSARGQPGFTLANQVRFLNEASHRVWNDNVSFNSGFGYGGDDSDRNGHQGLRLFVAAGGGAGGDQNTSDGGVGGSSIMRTGPDFSLSFSSYTGNTPTQVQGGAGGTSGAGAATAGSDGADGIIAAGIGGAGGGGGGADQTTSTGVAKDGGAGGYPGGGGGGSGSPGISATFATGGAGGGGGVYVETWGIA